MAERPDFLCVRLRVPGTTATSEPSPVADFMGVENLVTPQLESLKAWWDRCVNGTQTCADDSIRFLSGYLADKQCLGCKVLTRAGKNSEWPKHQFACGTCLNSKQGARSCLRLGIFTDNDGIEKPVLQVMLHPDANKWFTYWGNPPSTA